MPNKQSRKCRSARRTAAGKASDFIVPFDPRPGDKVVLCCRVSKSEQKRSGKLDRQVRNAGLKVEKAEADLIEVIQHTGSGQDFAWIIRAAAIARKHGAILVAESTDRFVRNAVYHSKHRPNAQATTGDLERLVDFADGVTLATLIDPDASPEEVRSYQRKRGQAESGHKGGRPKRSAPGAKKQRREARLKLVLRHYRFGDGVRETARWTRLPVSTVQRWIDRWELVSHFSEPQLRSTTRLP